MFRGIFAAALLLGTAPVSAESYFATVSGIVSSQFDTGFTAPGATSPIRIGDTITATFSYMTVDGVASALGVGFGKVGPKKATFTIGDFTWTSAGDFGSGFEPITFDAGPDPLARYYSTMDDAVGAGDLRINGYAFEISDFGYDFYTGPGFSGSFDSATLRAYRDGVLISAQGQALAAPDNQISAPVPEAAVWMMMIAGFGLAGTALRSRKVIPALA